MGVSHTVKVANGDLVHGPAYGPEEWPSFFRELVLQRKIDAVFVFGDCRPIHRPAIEIAKELGIQVWVFEPGLYRYSTNRLLEYSLLSATTSATLASWGPSRSKTIQDRLLFLGESNTYST